MYKKRYALFLFLVWTTFFSSLNGQENKWQQKVGKDGDVVLWSDNPLAIYAKPLYTIIEGTIYFDRQKDEQLQKQVDEERLRLVRKMNGEKRSGMPTIPAQPSYQIMHSCSDHAHSHGLLVIDADEINND